MARNPNCPAFPSSLKPLALLIPALYSGLAGANPVDPTVVMGTAAFAAVGKTLTITNSANAVINWRGFSIGSGETTRFIQSGAASQVLNRVTGGDPSQILGTLASNGRVFLINPNGIAFGPGSQVDVAGLVASTLNLSNSDFLAGKLNFQATPGAGKITNQGTIQTASGGEVYLVAPSIENSGVVVAPDGSVILAAGKSVSLIDPRNPEIAVEIAAENQAVNLGQIVGRNISMFGGIVTNRASLNADSAVRGPGGTIQLKASQDLELDGGSRISADGADGGSITLKAGNFLALGGTASAQGADGEGGRISGSGQSILHHGALEASGGNQGGTIELVADHRLIQTSSALLDASSVSGQGGTIRVEARSAGDPALPEGERSRVFSSATFKANGERGGEIRVLGDDVLLFAATGEARGRTQGGTILVGGDAHGANPAIANAVTTTVNATTTLDVSATAQGDAGRAIVWSDRLTQFGGTIRARGGALGGDGGFVEVSGKDALHFAGLVDAGAPLGKAGTLLLDPKNITVSAVGSVPAYQLIDPNSAANNFFGADILVLSNGNVVVTSPGDSLVATKSGAVYLFDGKTGALVSTLTGSQANDRVGSLGVVPLNNGNYVVANSQWSNGAASEAGAVTWGSGATGVSGVVSAANSLVGTTAGDHVGGDFFGDFPEANVVALANGNYVVGSFEWANGGAASAGAVTWGNGTTGIVGVVSAANSLVGGQTFDFVGRGRVTELTNGNYVVSSPDWANGAASQAGAVTWGSGTAGVVGAVSAANSLVGTQTNDRVGVNGITALTNGNYVANSNQWANGPAAQAGAVTWGDGSTGIVGAVSAANSLVGSQTSDSVGSGGVTQLTNGNYVVSSYTWDSGATVNVGAVTWGNGTTGVVGAVSAANSLVGTQGGDSVGFGGVTALTNDNYVVDSYQWANGLASGAGAVTWGNGTTGIVGAVSAANSLVGTQTSDRVGLGGVTALTNGNYVVNSYQWANVTVTNAGAVTWGNGTTGRIGAVSAGNSLVGTQVGDDIGIGGITALPNGNYVVGSPDWANGAATNAGAATWGNGTSGVFGAVSAANSLVGTQFGDSVGLGGITVLNNSNYVVRSYQWANGLASGAGSVTWGSGTTGVVGVVSAANSLVGSQTGDFVGAAGITELTNGNYVVTSHLWANGAATIAGAVTWGSGTTGVVGVVSAANSLVGTQANDLVGGHGITALANGNYVVASDNWDNGATAQAGAVTLANGTTGTVGAVSAANSLVGFSAGDMIGSGAILSLTTNDVIVSSPLSASGAGRVDVLVTAGATFAGAPGADATIGPAWITAITNTGTALALQANNDITVNAPITTVAGGAGGDLSLHAGRSIFVNADITTDNGALFLSANDPGANPAYRGAGPGDIVMAAGTTLNTGTGSLTATLNGQPGSITLANLNAATLDTSGATVMIGIQSLVDLIFGGGNLFLGAGASVNVANTVSVPTGFNMTMGSGSSLDAGSLSVDGTLDLSGGALTAGPTTVLGTGNLNLSSGTATFTGTLDLTGSGAFNYALAGTTTVAGLTTVGSILHVDTNTLKLAAGLTMLPGAVVSGGGSNTVDLAGSAWTFSGAGSFSQDGVAVINAGSFGGIGATQIYDLANVTQDAGAAVSAGTVNLTNARLNKVAGGSLIGEIFNLDSTSVLNFIGGTFSVSGNVTVNGTGTVNITGGTFAGPGTLVFNAPATAVAATLGTVPIIGNASFSADGSTFGALFTNNSVLSLANTSAFNGGLTLGPGSATVGAGATADLGGSALTFAGTGVYSVDGVRIQNFGGPGLGVGQTLNLANATWDFFAAPTNAGALNLTNATLNLHAGANNIGNTDTLDATSTINLLVGTLNVTGTYTQSGAGTVNYAAGTTIIGSGNIVNNLLQLESGDVGIPITNNGTLTANAAVFSQTVTNNGTLNLTGSTLLAPHVLTGTTNLAGANTFSGGLTIPGGKGLGVTAGTSLDAATLAVAGTMDIVGGGLTAGATTINGGGQLNLTSGTADFIGKLDIQVGGKVVHGLSGTTNVAGLTTNAGTLELNSNTLVLAGGYTALPGSLLFSSGGATVDLAFSTETFSGAGSFNQDGVEVVNALGGTLVAGQQLNLSNVTQDIFGPIANAGTLNMANATVNLHAGAALNGTSHILDGGSTINILGGTVSVSGTVNQSGAGTVNFTGGTMNGPGNLVNGLTFNISGAAVLDVPVTNNGTMNVNGVTLNQVLTNNSVLDLIGATLNQPFVLSGVTSLSGANTFAGGLTIPGGHTLGVTAGNSVDAATLAVAGTMDLTGGGLAAGATTVNGGGQLKLTSGTADFTGTLDIQAGGKVVHGLSGTTNVAGLTTNAGTLELNSNTLVLAGGYTALPGSLLFSSGGATVDLASSTETFSGAGSFNQDGVEVVNALGGTLVAGQQLNLSNVTQDIFGPIANAGTLNMANATVNLHAGAALNGTSHILDGGSTINILGGTVSVSGTVNQSGAGTVNFTGGTMNGPGNLVNGLTFNISGAAVLDVPVTNNGTMNVTGLSLGQLVTNAGTLNLGGVSMAQTYTLQGMTNLSGANTFSGGVIIPVGATLTGIAGTSIDFAGSGMTISGAGAATVSGLTLASLGATTISPGQNLVLSGTTLTSIAGFNNSGSVSLTGSTATLSGGGSLAGVFNVGSGSTLNFSGGAFAVGGTATLAGSGSTVFSGASFSGGGTLNNAGNLTVAATTAMSGPLANTGNLVLADGVTLALPTLVQSAGLAQLGTGVGTSATVAGDVHLTGGVFGGSGSVTGTLTVTGGVLAPGFSPGVMTVGGLVIGPGGTLLIEIGGTTPGAYDVINVLGAAALDGTLDIAAYGGFTPTTTHTLNFLTFGSSTGAFASVNLPATWSGSLTSFATFLELTFSPTIDIVPGITLPGGDLAAALQDIQVSLDRAVTIESLTVDGASIFDTDQQIFVDSSPRRTSSSARATCP